MKRGSIWGSLILLSVLLIAGVSAEIFIDELKSVYNVGDTIGVNVSLSYSTNTAGFLQAYLVCGANDVETYKSMQSIPAGEQRKVNFNAILGNDVIGSLGDSCYIRALYGSGEARSQEFAISRLINIELGSDNVVYLPEERVSITGKVIKDNREPLNGVVNVQVEGINVQTPKNPIKISGNSVDSNSVEDNSSTSDNEGNDTTSDSTTNESETTGETETTEDNGESVQDIIDSILADQAGQTEDGEIEQPASGQIIIGSFSAEVIDGEFSASFPIPKNAPPGDYKITASALDTDINGVQMNNGSAFIMIKVKQVITDLDLKINEESVTPGNDFSYTPVLYDQAGNEGQGEVTLTISKPDKSVLIERVASAGQPSNFFVEFNSTPGIWEVKAAMEDYQRVKTFSVEELRQISTNLSAGVLIVTNTGNVLFEGPIEVSIGNKTTVSQVSLEVGESSDFKLGAPDGEYEVSVSDGKSVQALGRTFLTGNVIGIDNGSFSLGKLSTWLIALVIIVLIFIVLVFIRKRMKKDNFGKIPRSIGTVGQGMYTRKESPVISGVTNLTDKGEKQEAAVIALKIKGEGNADLIEHALIKAKVARAKIYVDKDYRIMVFVPSLTKSKENEVIALNVAKEIENILKRGDSGGKFSWGIGVHYGQMAVESSDGNIKFVSLDNTISIAKRAAESSGGGVLLSEQMHRRTFGKAKVDKLEGTNFWQLKRISNREHYEDFLKRFLNRQQKK